MKNFLKWALIITVLSIVLDIISFFAIGNDIQAYQHSTMASVLMWAAIIAGLACLFLGVKQKKEMDPADFTFGRGWVEGFLISILSGLFIGIWTYVYFSFINPEVVDMFRQITFSEMAKTQSGEAVTQTRPYVEFMISPAGFFLTKFMGYLLGGMIVSLIVSAIVNAMGGSKNNVQSGM